MQNLGLTDNSPPRLEQLEQWAILEIELEALKASREALTQKIITIQKGREQIVRTFIEEDRTFAVIHRVEKESFLFRCYETSDGLEAEIVRLYLSPEAVKIATTTPTTEGNEAK